MPRAAVLVAISPSSEGFWTIARPGPRRCEGVPRPFRLSEHGPGNAESEIGAVAGVDGGTRAVLWAGK